MRRPRILLLLALSALCACVEANPKKGTPWEDLTLQNLVRWPDGKEYLDATATASPAEGVQDSETRKQTAREAAATAAQEKLIVELKKLVPREKVRELLRQAEVAKLDYGYDDACTLTLRIPRELISGSQSPW